MTSKQNRHLRQESVCWETETSERFPVSRFNDTLRFSAVFSFHFGRKKFRNAACAAGHLFSQNDKFFYARGLGGLSPYEQFLQISTLGKSVKKLSVDVHRQCLLFRHAYIRKQCLLLRPVS